MNFNASIVDFVEQYKLWRRNQYIILSQLLKLTSFLNLSFAGSSSELQNLQGCSPGACSNSSSAPRIPGSVVQLFFGYLLNRGCAQGPIPPVLPQDSWAKGQSLVVVGSLLRIRRGRGRLSLIKFAYNMGYVMVSSNLVQLVALLFFVVGPIAGTLAIRDSINDKVLQSKASVQ